MSDTPMTRAAPPPVERPPDPRMPAAWRPAPPGANGKALMQQATHVLGAGVHSVAKAASEVPRRRYLAMLLRGFGLLGLFVVYQTIEAEGLRELFGDVVGKRLSKAAPLLLGWMAFFEETRRLDMANALAAAFLLFTYLSWEAVVYRIVHRAEGEPIGERSLVLVPAITLLVIDTILFAVGVHANGSFSTPIPAFLLALGYDAMLVLFSFWVVKIERRHS